MRAAETILAEGLGRERDPALQSLQHDLGVGADLVLRMRIGAQAQEIEQVEKIRLPVPLSIKAEREVHARELARQALAAGIDHGTGLVRVEQGRVVAISAERVLAQEIEHARGLVRRQLLAAALAVALRLRGDLLGRRQIELVVQDRVARGVLVHVGRAVPDPLPCHEDRQLHVVLDLAHLERRGVPMAHQVLDKPAVLADLLGALAVGDAGRLHDRRIVAHVIDYAHEAMIQHGRRLVEDRLQRRHRGAAGRLRLGALPVDLGLLLGRQRHEDPSLGMAGRVYRGRERGSKPGADSGPLDRAVGCALTGNPYIESVGQPTMAINGAWNKRCGPGGSTRRLHQFSPAGRAGSLGGEPGSTRVVKVLPFARHGTAVIGPT